MSWRAYSLNTPKDEVLKVEIPKNATYDIVVEKLWLGLLESGVSQDVKVHEVSCGVSCSVSDLTSFAKNRACNSSSAIIPRELMEGYQWIVPARDQLTLIRLLCRFFPITNSGNDFYPF